MAQQTYILQPVVKYGTDSHIQVMNGFPVERTVTNLRAAAVGTSAWKENGQYKVEVPFQLFAKEAILYGTLHELAFQDEQSHDSTILQKGIIDDPFNKRGCGFNSIYFQSKLANNYSIQTGVDPIIEMNINQKLRVDYPSEKNKITNNRSDRIIQDIYKEDSLNKFKKIELTRKPPQKKSTKIAINRKPNIESSQSEYDLTDYWNSSLPKATPINPTKEEQRQIIMLMAGAPLNSIRQTIHVEKQEENIKGNDKNGSVPLLNFDTVSESVNLSLKDGISKLQVNTIHFYQPCSSFSFFKVKVKCERVIPINEKKNYYKKSSIIVTRQIDIDLEVTKRRKGLLEKIRKASHADEKGRVKLSTTDTFKLYRIFIGMAEAGEELKNQKIALEEEVDEKTKKPKELADLDTQKVKSHRRENMEFKDNLSFNSAFSASKVQKDILY